ncbi:peptidylprolyl isomerase [Sphingomonas daechungensis]|uniref:peptidylprolyl isomerase n=1 Tax=Sphingomonas daechungensis TaxID=1176646 RepID=UPI003783454E
MATTAAAQDAADQQPAGGNSASALKLPDNPQIFGQAMPSVIKATAIVNGEVITQTDVDQRLALLVIANSGKVPNDQVEELRQQVLRNLIDESLQIQAAKQAEITVTDKDIARTLERVASSVKMNPDQLTTYLKANGSSIRTLRRQIEGETAWRRLQQQKIENTVSVGDDEVKAVLERLNASKGTEEYRVGEIFLSSTPDKMQQTIANANQIIGQLRQGASFPGYARQYSEASTAAVGGDLGWVRPEQLPDQLGGVLRTMGPGQISSPISVPGGVSILAVQDARKILSADPRNAVLSLKQVSIAFPPGTSRPQAEARVAKFAEAARNVGGCGGAERIAAEFNGEVVANEGVRLRELPQALQEIMLPLQVGQATRPFGSIEEGVRTLVICGRDEADPTAPTFDQVFNQLSEERVNLRARRYLRDLRRDAVIEFR